MAGWKFYGGDCIVVDFGTALTFTVVKDNLIHGVAIAPGVRTALKSLTENAAKLFDVPLEMPESVFGKNTVHAIQSGILFGYEGLVKGMILRIRNEIGNEKIPVIATGGLSEVIEPLKTVFTNRDANLTLEGLRIIATYF
jgi:type III pantothenate kinase